MTAVKKSIALIMLTLVMVIGSFGQTLAASADTIPTYAGRVQYFRTVPNLTYQWTVRNTNPDTLTATVRFKDDETFDVPGNNSRSGFSQANTSEGLVRTTKDASFTWNIAAQTGQAPKPE